jgi:adenylyl-sulfate kinase
MNTPLSAKPPGASAPSLGPAQPLYPPSCIWLTGLSGAGKTTLAHELARALQTHGVRCATLDGDVLRTGLNADLGFSESDRRENIRRVAEVARLMVDAGLVVIVSLISPFRRDRERARERLGNPRFLEVFVDTPLAVCEQRDVKGLYARARRGELPEFTGIASPYEAPEQPNLHLRCDQCSPQEAVSRILDRLATQGQ